jgi:hypothetical protein
MNRSTSNYFPFIVLFLLVLFSRLGFLLPGYGIEEDSWGIALAAKYSHEHGIYEPSRFPGHPVQEIIFSLFPQIGAWGFNFLSAFFSAVAALFFALSLKHLNFRSHILAAAAFAFVPVIYISSTYTIDFMWTEAFVLIALYNVLKRNLILAGFFLGLACGCRITSGAMLIPFFILFYERGENRKNILSLLKIGFAMGAVTLLAYLPLIQRFGFSFFMYYDQFPYPPLAKVFYKMIPGAFGFLGCIALLFALIASFFSKAEKTAAGRSDLQKRMLAAAIVVLILYFISYLRLPQKSGYMIPVIPFVIWLAGYLLELRFFKLFCYLMVLSSFLFSINLTDSYRGAEYSSVAVKLNVAGQELFFDPLSGPVYSDLSKRRKKMLYAASVIERAQLMRQKTMIIAGWWYNQIMVMTNENTGEYVVFRGYSDEAEMKSFNDQGYRIYYLPEQKTYNDLMFRINSTGNYASEFEKEFQD